MGGFWDSKLGLGILGGAAIIVVGIGIAVAVTPNGDNQNSAAPTTTPPTQTTPHKKNPSTTTAKQEGNTGSRQSAESQSCNDLPVSTDRYACHDSYAICAANRAKAKVQAYYSGNGPTLDSIATRYAKGTYGTSFYGAWQAGYAGCYAALGAEYDRLYGGG